MILYLGARGLVASWHLNGRVSDLVRSLKRGDVPIVDWSDWGGHYGVVRSIKRRKGYLGGRIVLADPAASGEARKNGLTVVSVERFKAMWFDRIPPRSRGGYILVRRSRIPSSKKRR